MVEIRDTNVLIPGPDATGLYNLYAVTPWKNIPLGTGWSNVGGNYATAQYRVVAGGRVVLKGYIQKSVALSLGETILTMPVKPAQIRVLGITSILSNNNVALQPFELRTTGELVSGTVVSLGLKISLEQIEYDAEQ